MSTTDVELLKQSLKILIDDFKTLKLIVYAMISVSFASVMAVLLKVVH